MLPTSGLALVVFFVQGIPGISQRSKGVPVPLTATRQHSATVRMLWLFPGQAKFVSNETSSETNGLVDVLALALPANGAPILQMHGESAAHEAPLYAASSARDMAATAKCGSKQEGSQILELQRPKESEKQSKEAATGTMWIEGNLVVGVCLRHAKLLRSLDAAGNLATFTTFVRGVFFGGL